NPAWGERIWPARVSAAPTRPTESAEPGPEESQPPNKPDLVDAPTPAGPAGIINIGQDPAIRRAIAHALERAKPAHEADVPVSETVLVGGARRDTAPAQPPAAPTLEAGTEPEESPPPAAPAVVEGGFESAARAEGEPELAPPTESPRVEPVAESAPVASVENPGRQLDTE